MGRKRQVDLLSEIAILEQIAKLCLSWVHFNNQLKGAAGEKSEKAGLAVLPAELRRWVADIRWQMMSLNCDLLTARPATITVVDPPRIVMFVDADFTNTKTWRGVGLLHRHDL